MSRYSSKIRDHVDKTRFRAQNHRLYLVIFLGQLPDGVLIIRNEHSVLPCPSRAATTRGRFDPVESPRSRGRKESAVKPGSVVDSHSSGMRVAAQL